MPKKKKKRPHFPDFGYHTVVNWMGPFVNGDLIEVGFFNGEVKLPHAMNERTV